MLSAKEDENGKVNLAGKFSFLTKNRLLVWWLLKLNILSGERYCIELIPDPSDPGNGVSILKNGQVVDTTPAQKNFVATHTTCFDSFDLRNDIIELRNGGNHGLTISVNLINGRLNTQLLFGKNADMTKLRIDGDHNGCREDYEKSSNIKIKNGIIIKSACVVNP